jgi:hypothetical protein
VRFSAFLLLALVGAARSCALTTCIVSNVVAAEVRGIVMYKYGEHERTIAGAKVELMNWAAPDKPLASAQSDGTGQFHSTGVRAGRYRPHAHGGHRRANRCSQASEAPHRFIHLVEGLRLSCARPGSGFLARRRSPLHEWSRSG